VSATTAPPTLTEQAVTIRPIRATDSALESEFIRNLSEATKHYRFLGGVAELPPAELKCLCEVDGSHSMAFVATVPGNGSEIEIGVCRYGEGLKEGVLEMAITIADAWQDKGLAQLLLKPLIAFARDHGVKQLYSVEFADNTAMRRLASDFGMGVTNDPNDSKQVIYSLTL
jgi:GNAT superfamily N-acetyltransferase